MMTKSLCGPRQVNSRLRQFDDRNAVSRVGHYEFTEGYLQRCDVMGKRIGCENITVKVTLRCSCVVSYTKIISLQVSVDLV